MNVGNLFFANLFSYIYDLAINEKWKKIFMDSQASEQ